MKSNAKIWLSVSILVLILAIGSGIYFIGNVNNAVVGGKLVSSGSVTGESFVCSGDSDDFCEVWGSGYCNDQSTSASVVFRTSDSGYGSGWIAFDSNGDTQLEGFQTITATTNTYSRSSLTTAGVSWFSVKTPEGYFVGRCPPTKSSCYSTSIKGGNYIIFKSSSEYTSAKAQLTTYASGSESAVTTGYPVQGYNQKETYSNYLFQCFPELKTGTGQLLKSSQYTNNVAGSIAQTDKVTISAGTSVSFGKWVVNYIEYSYGQCGECTLGEKENIDGLTYKECQVVDGCGEWKPIKIQDNYFFNDISKKVEKCSSGDVCVDSTRTGVQTSCVNTPIIGCCKLDSECKEKPDNACTTNTCTLSTHTCKVVVNPDCCNPSCADNQFCSNGVCSLKTGCRWLNDCTFPQICNNTLDLNPYSGGRCVCPTTSEYCGSSLFNTEKCDNNQIFACLKDSSGLCNTWQLKETCGETELCI
jgi:hypothetical protein